MEYFHFDEVFTEGMAWVSAIQPRGEYNQLPCCCTVETRCDAHPTSFRFNHRYCGALNRPTHGTLASLLMAMTLSIHVTKDDYVDTVNGLAALFTVHAAVCLRIAEQRCIDAMFAVCPAKRDVVSKLCTSVIRSPVAKNAILAMVFCDTTAMHDLLVRGCRIDRFLVVTSDDDDDDESVSMVDVLVGIQARSSTKFIATGSQILNRTTDNSMDVDGLCSACIHEDPRKCSRNLHASFNRVVSFVSDASIMDYILISQPADERVMFDPSTGQITTTLASTTLRQHGTQLSPSFFVANADVSANTWCDTSDDDSIIRSVHLCYSVSSMQHSNNILRRPVFKLVQ